MKKLLVATLLSVLIAIAAAAQSGRHVKNPGPHGLRLTHARITGSLDLDRLTPIMGLALSSCVVDRPITAFSAVISGPPVKPGG